MAQEYTVDSWKAWENDEGLIRDPHGNYKGTVTFVEDRSEPIDATFKTQPNVGDKKYGTVGEYTTKAGKVRKGFKSAQKPQENFANSGNPAHFEDRSDGMRQGMCINNATLFVNLMFEMSGNKPSPDEWADTVFTHAQALYIRGELKPTKVVAQTLNDTFNVTDKDIDEPINLNDIPF